MFDVRYLCHIVRIPFFVPGVMDHMWELFLSCSLRLCVVCLYLTQNLYMYMYYIHIDIHNIILDHIIYIYDIIYIYIRIQILDFLRLCCIPAALPRQPYSGVAAQCLGKPREMDGNGGVWNHQAGAEYVTHDVYAII